MTTTTTPAVVLSATAGPGDFLTARQVAETLGIAKTSVYDHIARGDLAHHRVGRLVRIRRHDLDAYIDRARVEVCPPRLHARYPQA